MTDHIVLVVGLGHQYEEAIAAIPFGESLKCQSATLCIGEENAPETVHVFGELTETAIALVAQLAKETGAFLKAEAGLPKFAVGDDILLVNALQTAPQGNTDQASGWRFNFDLISTE